MSNCASMSPLLKHGRDASLIADLIKVLLDATGANMIRLRPRPFEI